jgi:quercetin 2,3-dioxygenase
MNRKVKSIKNGMPVMEGAGVRVIRILNNHDVNDFDPFLMLDAFDSENPADYIKGFPWHPHRGIETVTYLIEGEIEHGDSLGNKGTIYDGDCQWMTAGSGIIHQEMPQPTARIRGLQVWLNLPAKNKMTHPQYRDITAKQIPLVKKNGYEVRIISGMYDGTQGAMQADYVQARFLDISIEANQRIEIDTNKQHTVFVYCVFGAVAFDDTDKLYAERKAVLLEKGDCLVLKTISASARVIVFDAPPLNEPIAWGGPIVMNTREELHHAFDELDKGTFIKHEKQV